jgi:cyclophilin family peptidyl-prolyl cis-trans isomerase/HEAT repeat protein
MMWSSSNARRGWLAAALALATPTTEGAARRPALAPPSRAERLARVLELEDRRSTGGGELERLLRDPDRGVRRRAALAAGRIGDAATFPALVEMMNDGEVELRRMAAFALGLARARVATERLRAGLADTDAGVRGRAAEALGRIGEPRVAAEVARLVVDSLPKTIGRMTVRDDPADPGDPWLEQRLALLALARLKDLPAAAHALLRDGEPRFDWWAATWVAQRLESPQLTPVLLAAAGSDDPRSRALAARGLGKLKDPGRLETLTSLARDADETVALEAIRALGLSADRRAITVAVASLQAKSDVLRREALLALSRLPPEPGLRPQVVGLLAERDPWVRGAAFAALAHLSPEDFALVLSGMESDPVPAVRAALAGALGALGDEMSVGLLHSMLQDQRPEVLAAVLESLRRSRGRDSLETLRRHLEHADLGVRAAAAEQLGALGASGAPELLLGAWRRGLRDGPGELEARLAAVGALAGLGGEGAAELRAISRQDPERAVRLRAGAALDAAVPFDAGEEAVLRPALDYRRAMAPYSPRSAGTLYTPRLFLQTKKGTIEIRLDMVEAPLGAAALVALARRGFYDGLVFHRVEPGFVVQGGCPRGDGNGGPGFTLRDEITRRPFGRGAVGLALSGKDTGGSQLFVTLAPQPQLDGAFPLVGQVVAGMSVVERIRPGDVIERAFAWTGE